MNEQMYSIGPIMKAARKFKKLNQADVALAIGCSQSALSKMEHNLLIPSAPQWFLFSRFTAIPPESLETGIIDRHDPIRVNGPDAVSLGFKLPKRYRQFRAAKVRELYPFLQYLEKEAPELAKEFVNTSGIDPEFFLDFDNLVNFQLMVDCLTFFIKHDKNSEAVIKRIVDIGQNPIYWNHFGINWKKLPTIPSVLNELAREQHFFQVDFQLKVSESDKLTLNYFPEPHLEQQAISLPEDVLKFLNLYRKYTIEGIIRITKGLEVKATQMSGTLAATFEIQLS